MSAREQLALFIQDEGHRVETASGGGEDAEILFRTRGCVVSVSVREGDPPSFQIATAYEIPPWARKRAHNAAALRDAGDEDGLHFALAADGKNFVAVLDCRSTPLGAFQREFWRNVARVREAGIAALERIVDRSESRAAADKFIKSFGNLGRR